MFTRPPETEFQLIKARRQAREPFDRQIETVEREAREACRDVDAELNAELKSAHDEFMARTKAAYDRHRPLHSAIIAPYAERLLSLREEAAKAERRVTA